MSQEVHEASGLSNFNNQSKETLECYLCGNKSLKALFSESRESKEYTSYHCSDCNLYQTLGNVDPLSPDYINLEEGDLNSAHRFLQTTHKLPAFKQWKDLIGVHHVKPLDESAVLDVGCGIGGFLDFALSLNLTTFGFDASNAHAKVARSHHPLVRHAISPQSYFQELGIVPHIDLVTLWDVFEHVRDPAKFLFDLQAVLRQSNGLLFVSVPSGAMNPVKVRIAKVLKRPAGLIPWEHVFYYTPKSLRRVVEEAGFEILDSGGVLPYIRQPVTIHECLRRTLHRCLRNTDRALQLYVIARPQQKP